MTEVLICGAGVAGSTLAYWLSRYGMRTTVVERAAGMRTSGNPVDVRGPAVPVVEAMGIVPRLRKVATAIRAMNLLDSDGRPVTRVRTPAGTGRQGQLEIPRADLASVLYEAARDDAEFRFDDTVTAVRQDRDGVVVDFEQAATRRFDLVVGADGVHSTVRRIAFGPEEEFVRHMGMYVATVPLGRRADRPDEVVMYNTPGRLTAVHPARGMALAAFVFRSPAIPGLDYRDTARHRQLVAQAYDGVGWEVPRLLNDLCTAEEFYFDAVSTVRLASWTRGRVTLVGDAANCVSLLGDGSSLAIVGARTLAASLADHRDHRDHGVALRAYEQQHRKLVAPKQRLVGLAASWLVPKTPFGVSARNVSAKLLPGAKPAVGAQAA